MEKGESRLQQLQGDVEDTKVIMVETYNKAIDRRINLEDTEERAEALLESSRRFQRTSRKVREKETGGPQLQQIQMDVEEVRLKLCNEANDLQKRADALCESVNIKS
ncbi:hypothetical protein KOW79_018364 [Hemibagrus wyckioides]|uniref:V-SNARE coiled-coil homology domain-containing protein n=1 Tax=Hemibagrus wyckioides TaxID=337641 RepID=A0A9D3NA08_9TELE|nr:hypothetical protein KOW79_018364 [Hemibagrus wyckioides]